MACAIGSRAHARISGIARRYKSYVVRSETGRSAARLISVSSSKGSMIPATLEAILSCSSNTSSSAPSNFSAHKCEPVAASMSCPVIRSCAPDFRTLPSST